jgi:hypothetical protein
MSPKVHDILQTAGQYCRLIESAEDGSDRWLHELTELLPRLHAAMTGIEPLAEGLGDPIKADLDARFDLFTRLRQLLGDRDGYWLEFDVAQDGQQMSGSLADDLTDIYCELKFGLKRLESDVDPNDTLVGWRHGFRVHWGQHLLDAERHLYALSARHQLATGAGH